MERQERTKPQKNREASTRNGGGMDASRTNRLPGRDWPGSCSEGREITRLGQRSG